MRVNEVKVYALDPDADRKVARALIDRFGAHRVWTSSGGGFELHHAAVAAQRPSPPSRVDTGDGG